MKSRFFKTIFYSLLMVIIGSSISVFAYDKYSLEDYAYFDPVTSSPCDETNYWTMFDQDTTCYRFIVLNPSDTSSDSTLKLLLDHDLGSSTFQNASSTLSSLTSSWTRYTGTISLADEDTMASLLKLTDRPEVTNGTSNSLPSGIRLFSLAMNTKIFVNQEENNDHGYWLSGTYSNNDYAYSMTETARNTLVLKTETRGIRPMIVVNKSLLTKSSEAVDLTGVLGRATQFKYPKPAQTYGGYSYRGLQGFTVTNSMLVFYSNSSDPDNGLILSYKGNSYDTLNRIDFGATGHGNGLTYDSKNNKVLVTGKNSYQDIVELDADSLEQTNTYHVGSYTYTSIGYDYKNDYYLGQTSQRTYILDHDFNKKYSFDTPTYLTGQDLEYKNGYLYYVAHESGNPNAHQLYSLNPANSSKIYVYNAKFKNDGTPEKGFGRLVRVYSIDNIDRENTGGTGEAEGISFQGGLVWMGYGAWNFDEDNPYKFYRFDLTNIMISPSYQVSYDEGDSYTTVTITSPNQLNNLAGWTLSSDKYSLSKYFTDQKDAFNVTMYDPYNNSVKVSIHELTTKKSDVSFPEASLNKEYSVGTYTYPATTASGGTITYQSNNESVATVDNNGKVTIHAIGIAKITATVSKGNGYYQGKATYTLNVTKSLQQLSFSETTIQKYYGDAPFTMRVSHSVGDGAITYSSSSPSVASVDNDGNVTIHSAGVTTITATAAGTTGFESASASYTLNVGKKSQGLSFSSSSISKYTGTEDFTISVNHTEGDGTITYSSSNTNVATVDNNGKVHVLSEGNTTISAMASETTNYLSATASYSLTVSVKTAQTLTFDSTTVEKTYQDPSYTMAVHHTIGDGSVTYSSSDTNVASVDNNGKVTIKNAGTTVITATASETSSYARTTASYTLNVRKKGVVVAFQESAVSKKYTDDDYTITAQVTSGEGTITYHSSDEGIASVNNNGKVTILDVGSVIITAVVEETTNYQRAEASYTLNVSKGEQVLTDEEDSSPIRVYDTSKQFAFEVSQEEGDGDLSYSSSNENVATIDEEAMVTVKAPGTTTLTAVAEETAHYFRQVYSRELVVEVSPVTSGNVVEEVVPAPNTSMWKKVPILAIGLLIIGSFFILRQYLSTKELEK